MSTSEALKKVFTAARPLIEDWLDIAEQIAALREVATNEGLDWSQVKALLKAQIQDERDEAGDGKRVRKLIDKAEFACAYADMLGLGEVNEKNISAPPGDKASMTVQFGDGPIIDGDDEAAFEAEASRFIAEACPPHDPSTGEIPDLPECLRRKKEAT